MYLAHNMDRENYQRDSTEAKENRASRITGLHQNAEIKIFWSHNEKSKI